MRGQEVANKLNKKYEEEFEGSVVQKYFANHPLAKLGVTMGRLPLMMGASMLPGGGAAAAQGDLSKPPSAGGGSGPGIRISPFP
jgi:hypothetical protein